MKNIFNIDSIKKYDSTLKINENYNKDTNIFYIDSELVKELKNNHREEYKNIANKLENNSINNIYDSSNDKFNYIILNNCIMDHNGIIYREEDKYYKCGCYIDNVNNNYTYRDLYDYSKKYDKIINISEMWGNGIWHFPMECLSSLMSINKEILYDKNIYIQVTQKTKYIIDWLKIIDIESDRIIDGLCYGKEVYIPKICKCGNPRYNEILWLKNNVNKIINNSNNINDDQKNNLVILIKRNNSRQLSNFSELLELVKNICNNNNLELYIHDDNHLPSLNKDATFIEFLDIENINLCYTRVAYFLNINYIAIPYKNKLINKEKINNILNKLNITNKLYKKIKENTSIMKLFIGTPCYGAKCFTNYVTALIATKELLQSKGIEVKIEFLGYESLIPRGRNTLIAKFMALEDFTHILFIDADIVWNPMDVYKLMLHNKDIIGGIYPQKKYHWNKVNNVNSPEEVSKLLNYNLNYKSRENRIENGLIELRHIPTGFMMIKREAIEQLKEFYPNKKYVDDIGCCQTDKEKDNLYAFFDCEIVDNHYLSEDYLFCENWNKLEGKVYADLTINLVHIGNEFFVGNMGMYVTELMKSNQQQ